MNRTDRLFAILLEIQSNPKITSQKLAERFDVTKRTIYRDVIALMDANVPVNGKAGEGYSIEEGYFLPPVSFTKDEALMLILGAGAVGRQFDSQYKKAARSAENKIHASLSKDLKKEIAYLKSYINVFFGMQGDSKELHDALLKIRRAILEKKRVAFRYFKPSAQTAEPMVREADPYALANYFGIWMMTGYDHLRKDLRVFRLDRMEAVLVTSKLYERPKNFSLSDLGKDDRSAGTVYRVKIARSIHRWVKEQPPYKVIKTESKKDHVYLTIASSSEDSIITWLLRWGTNAEAISPPSFRRNVKSILAALLHIYE